MKWFEKKRSLISLVLAFALLLLPVLFNSHIALADKDERENKVKVERSKVENKKESHKYEDDDEDEDEDEDEEYEHEGKYNSPVTTNTADVAANNPTPASNTNVQSQSAATAAPTAQPTATPIVNGQSATIKVDGQAATLKVTLNLVPGSSTEVRVDAEKVLQFLNVPFVKYNSGILEMYGEGRHVIFHSGKKVAFVNGQKQTLPSAPVIENGQYLIQLNILSSMLGYTLEWHSDTQTFLLKRGA